jgi:hypothetical protein
MAKEKIRKVDWDTTDQNWMGTLPVVNLIGGAKEGSDTEIAIPIVTANGKLKVEAALDASDISIGAVEIKDATTDTRATVGADGVHVDVQATVGLTDDELRATPVDVLGPLTDTELRATAVPVSGPLTDAELRAALLSVLVGSVVIPTHTSPNDFTAAYTSSSTITLTGYPIALVSGEQIIKITQFKADNTYAEWVNGINCKLDFSAGVITIYGAGTPFVAADKYMVGLLLQDKAYDASLDIQKTVDQSPVWNKYTDPVNLVTEQNLTATNDVIGANIDVRGYKTLTLFIAADANDSEDVTLSVYSLKASGGSVYTPSESGAVASIALWVGAGSDSLKSYRLDVEGYSYVQLKVIAGTVGGTAGDLTIDIAKEY